MPNRLSLDLVAMHFCFSGGRVTIISELSSDQYGWKTVALTITQRY